MLTILLLTGCMFAGAGLTFLSGVKLSLEERISYGTVAGAVAVSVATFVVSLAVRDVTIFTVLAGFTAALVAGLLAAWWHRADLRAGLEHCRHVWWVNPLTASHPWPVLAVFVACGAWTVHFLHQAYVLNPAGLAPGLYAGYQNIWGDWAAHLTYAGSFAYGHNFPPEYPMDPGNALGYPWMIDFLAADLVPLGASLPDSLVLTSGLLGLAFPVVFYLAALRFTGMRAAATIAVSIFLMSGGLGFVYLAADVDKSGFGTLLHLPREYTLDRDLNYQWLNPVLAYLVPQRTTLFGFSLVLILLALLFTAVRDRLGWVPFVFAGVVAGLMPPFHIHAFGTVVALSVFWAAFDRRREWIYFFAPALLVGLPQLLFMLPHANNSICGNRFSVAGYCLQPGWMAYSDWQRDGLVAFLPDFVWFWIKNMSMFVPLLVAGFVMAGRLPSQLARYLAPMWLWFLVPSVIVLQPWEWDNTKFFIFWALLGSMVVGVVLANWFRRGAESAALAAAMIILMCLSGALDLARASDFRVSQVQFTDSGGIRVADWVRMNTDPRAIFAVADEHNSPIPTLAGRRVMVGYPGWLWTYDLKMSDYMKKGDDERAILRGDPATPALVALYDVSFVLIGPQELAPSRGANRSYWDAHGQLVYSTDGYFVYRVSAKA